MYAQGRHALTHSLTHSLTSGSDGRVEDIASTRVGLPERDLFFEVEVEDEVEDEAEGDGSCMDGRGCGLAIVLRSRRVRECVCECVCECESDGCVMMISQWSGLRLSLRVRWK